MLNLACLKLSAQSILLADKGFASSSYDATPENIYWESSIVDGQDLYERLQAAEVIMQKPQGFPLRLLIIDSIAHLFRDIGDHPGSSAYVHRTGMLFRISALLRRFADVYNLCVVITNQVGHSPSISRGT